MVWFKIICLLFLAYLVRSSDFCELENNCKCVFNSSSVIDLTGAVNLGGITPGEPLFYEVSLGYHCNQTQLYSYNPCFPFDILDKHTKVEVGKKPCQGAAACVKIPGDSSGSWSMQHAIGLQNSTKFGIDDNEQIYINYTFPDPKRNLKVNLICGSGNEQSLIIHERGCSDDRVVLNFTSKCACPNGCTTLTPSVTPSESHLSTGSKLLIAFFTILIAYLIVGILWNFCNGAQGAEILPNLAFWTDLPTLIMEGVTFTFSCCSRKSTYGDI